MRKTFETKACNWENYPRGSCHGTRTSSHEPKYKVHLPHTILAKGSAALKRREACVLRADA
jgi:hypothetical protein